MHVTWTALELAEPAAHCPWTPRGSAFWQAGHCAGPRAEVPDLRGRWWSVVAVWDDEAAARDAGAQAASVGTAWHVVLAPASFRGDAVLSGGARPFAALPPAGRVAGAAAVVTLAGLSPDPARTGEFFTRFAALGEAVRQAPGARAAMVQAPADGAVLTFSAWDTLRDALTWAYHRPPHAGTVRRHEEQPLVDSSGFLRCAVVASSGTLAGRDPLAGRTGTVVPRAAVRA